MSKLVRTIAFVWLLTGLCLPAAAAAKVTDLLAGRTRPDFPLETFQLWSTPVIEGEDVVFMTSRAGAIDAIWRYRLDTAGITKLVGIGAKAPGSTATFTCFCLAFASDDATPRLRDGRLAFFALDTSGASGLYQLQLSAPKKVARVASTVIKSADGSRYKRFGGGVDFGSRTISFYAETEGGHRGVHTASLADGTARVLIDERTRLGARGRSGPVPEYYSAYYRVVANAAATYFYATGLFDPVSGANAIFRTGRSIVVDNMTALPGGSAAHTRIGLFSAPLGSGPVAFLADQPDTGYAGVFRATAGRTALLITSTKRNAPGIHKPFEVFSKVCAGADAVAFVATANGRTGIYWTPTGGSTVAIAQQGPKYYKLTAGDGCLSGRRVVFREDGGGNRLLLGTP